MRGADVMTEELFTVGGLDQYVQADYALRPVRDVFNGCLARMDTHFDGLYSPFGRESIAPEKLLRALLLQVLLGIRSERQLVEQLRYNMLYRWFVGLPLHEQPRDHSTFTKNRERLLEGGTPEVLFQQVLDCARAENLHGFAAAATLTHATGTAEREAALAMMDQTADSDRVDTERRTLGADKNYDTAEFVADCRARNITPHVAQNTRRSGGSAIDGRTSRHAGYEISQTKRQMALTGGNLLKLVNLTG